MTFENTLLAKLETDDHYQPVSAPGLDLSMIRVCHAPHSLRYAHMGTTMVNTGLVPTNKLSLQIYPY